MLLCLVLYLPGIGSLPLTDRDEGHYVQASKQLIESKQYFEIKFQDKPRHLKPPGIYWLQTASVSTFSQVDSTQIWPYRLPSFFGALFAILCLYYMSRALVGDRQAFWGSAFFASSLLMIVEAHLALTDAVLVMSIVGMQTALWRIYQPKNKSQYRYALMFWTFMAFGFLIKGLTPLFGALTIVFLLLIDRDRSWIKGLHLKWGLPLFLLLSVSWIFALSIHSHSNFLWDMFKGDALPKLQGGQEKHGQWPGYYLLVSLIALWPISLFLFEAIFYGWANRSLKILKFLAAWALPAWLVYELIPTKLPQYLLPIYPAISLWIATLLVNTNGVELPFKRIRLIYMGFWVLISLFLAAIVSGVFYYLQMQIPVSAMILSLILIVGVSISVVLNIKNRRLASAQSLVYMICLVVPFLFYKLPPDLKEVWIARHVAEISELKNFISEQQPLLVVGFNEPSLVFYLGTHQVEFLDTALATQKLGYNYRWLLVEENVAMDLKPFKLSLIKTINGFNYSTGKWIKLNLYRKN